LKSVGKDEADIAWIVYDLQLVDHCGQEKYALKKVKEIYTQFEPSLQSITTPLPGTIDEFLKRLQDKLDEQLETAPINNTIEKDINGSD
jgi:ABC-type cobalt transport system substrate-binding protein